MNVLWLASFSAPFAAAVYRFPVLMVPTVGLGTLITSVGAYAITYDKLTNKSRWAARLAGLGVAAVSLFLPEMRLPMTAVGCLGYGVFLNTAVAASYVAYTGNYGRLIGVVKISRNKKPDPKSNATDGDVAASEAEVPK